MLTSAFLISPGCGYLSSGQWENDPGNWTRAFGESVPDGIKVVNSWYTRTAHFTAEYAWFFKLQLDVKSRSRIETDPDFLKLKSVDFTDLKRQIYSDRPKWFPLDALDSYDVYQSQSQPSFLIFLERDGYVSYWTAYQL